MLLEVCSKELVLALASQQEQSPFPAPKSLPTCAATSHTLPRGGLFSSQLPRAQPPEPLSSP